MNGEIWFCVERGRLNDFHLERIDENKFAGPRDSGLRQLENSYLCRLQSVRSLSTEMAAGLWNIYAIQTRCNCTNVAGFLCMYIVYYVPSDEKKPKQQSAASVLYDRGSELWIKYESRVWFPIVDHAVHRYSCSVPPTITIRFHFLYYTLTCIAVHGKRCFIVRTLDGGK